MTLTRSMFQKVADSSPSSIASSCDYRPPKPPTSTFSQGKSGGSPSSPRRRKSKNLSHNSPKQRKECDSSSSLSPTSVVVEGKGLFADPSHQHASANRKKKDKRRLNRKASNPGPCDESLVEAGHGCLRDGNHAGAVFCFQLLVKERTRLHGPHHPMVATSLYYLGRAHLQFQQYPQAEKAFGRAAAIQNRTTRRSHPQHIVASLVKLGQVRLCLQQYEAAQLAFRNAVHIVRTHFGYDHSKVSELQTEIGYLFYEAGDLSSALNAFCQALVVYRAIFVHGEYNIPLKAAMSETLCNIGSIHLKRKDFNASIDCFLEALQMQRESMGDFHPNVIVTLDNLAFCHVKKKEYGKAHKYYDAELQAQVAFYGEYNHICSETKRKEQLVYKKLHRGAAASRSRAFTA